MGRTEEAWLSHGSHLSPVLAGDDQGQERTREKRTTGKSKVGEGCMEVSASWLLLGKSLGAAMPLESGTY